MTLLAASLLLAALGVALFPCWRYSARWGFGPCVTVGVLLVLVGLIAVTGKDDRASERPHQPQRVVHRADGVSARPPPDTIRTSERPLAGAATD